MFAVWVSSSSSDEEEPEKEVGNFWVCRLRRYERETPTEGKIARWIDGWIRGSRDTEERGETPKRRWRWEWVAWESK